MQAYDRDFFKSNDIIGSTQIDLKQAFEDVSLTNRPLQINKEYFEKYMLKKDGSNTLDWQKDDDAQFWINMTAKNDDGVLEFNGKVRCQIDIVPVAYAEANAVGSARDEPNVSPFLPPPLGRLHFSFNPCEMYKQMIGPAMRRKICIWCTILICCALCITMIVFLAPIILGNMAANLL